MVVFVVEIEGGFRGCKVSKKGMIAVGCTQNNVVI